MRSAMRCLCFGAAVLSAASSVLDDASGLLQSFSQEALRPKDKRASKGPDVRNDVRHSLGTILSRYAKAVNMPLPAPARWQLTSKGTNWVMQQYNSVKSPAKKELLDSTVELLTSVLAAKDDPKVSNEQLLANLAQWDRLAAIGGRYAEQVGGPQGVPGVLDRAAAAAKGEANWAQVAKDSWSQVGEPLLLKRAREHPSPHVQALGVYLTGVKEGQAQWDREKVLDLTLPLLEDHTPPALSDFARSIAAEAASPAGLDQQTLIGRGARALALSSRQLKLPSGLSDLLDWVGDTEAGGTDDTGFFDALIKLGEQLELHPAAVEIFRYLGEEARNHREVDPYKFFGLISSAMEKAGAPQIMQTFFHQLMPDEFLTMGNATNPQAGVELAGMP